MGAPSAKPQAPACCGGQSLLLQCAGCATVATVDLRGFTVEAAANGCVGVTYADSDIVVWDCPACGAANADER